VLVGGGWYGSVWVSGGRKWVLGSSKATNVACLAVFDPDTNSALSRQLARNPYFCVEGGFCFRVVDIYNTVVHIYTITMLKLH
jgi:hypothetical protein